MTDYKMKCETATAPEATNSKSRPLTAYAVTTPEAKLQIRSLHEGIKRNLPWLAVLIVISVATAWLGMVLQGWASFAASIAGSVLSFFVGLKAVTNVIREIIYPAV
jgi:hypothetical protein